MDINNFDKVSYDDGLNLFFDKSSDFRTLFNHKLKTRRVPYYKNILLFLEENKETQIYFTRDESVKPFQKIDGDFLINIDAYLNFCATISRRTGGRLKAFLGQNINLKNITITDTEKDEFVQANVSEKNILEAFKNFDLETRTSVLSSLKSLNLLPNLERLPDDTKAIDVLRKILSSEENKKAAFEFFKEQYPELDKKILTYKLVQSRRKALVEFSQSLDDPEKIERNYWQPFLEKNRWMFGLSYFVLLDDSRIDLENNADYLLEAEDGFIDIVEIKHPHVDFWQQDHSGSYKKYRGFLQPSDELKGATTQAIHYIFQVEKKFNDPDWQRTHHCETPVKPTCTIILGRSNSWAIEEKTAFRLLNDSLHGVEIITFDQLYIRAEKILKTLEEES
jgi:hypothetical protein